MWGKYENCIPAMMFNGTQNQIVTEKNTAEHAFYMVFIHET